MVTTTTSSSGSSPGRPILVITDSQRAFIPRRRMPDISALMGFKGAVFTQFFGSGLEQAVTAGERNSIAFADDRKPPARA